MNLAPLAVHHDPDPGRDLYTLCSLPRDAGLFQARKLVDAGAKVNWADNEGFTPLIRAAAEGNMRVVHLLLDAGARLDATTATGLTALAAAALEGHAQMVELLLSRGAQLDKNSPVKARAFVAGVADTMASGRPTDVRSKLAPL